LDQWLSSGTVCWWSLGSKLGFCFASHLAELALDACFVVAEWEQENKREMPNIQELDDVTQKICEQRSIVQMSADRQVVGRP